MRTTAEEWFNTIYDAAASTSTAPGAVNASIAYRLSQVNRRLYEKNMFSKLYTQDNATYVIVFPNNQSQNRGNLVRYNGVIFALEGSGFMPEWVQVCNPMHKHRESVDEDVRERLSARIERGQAEVFAAYLGPVVNLWHHNGL